MLNSSPAPCPPGQHLTNPGSAVCFICGVSANVPLCRPARLCVLYAESTERFLTEHRPTRKRVIEARQRLTAFIRAGDQTKDLPPEVELALTGFRRARACLREVAGSWNTTSVEGREQAVDWAVRWLRQASDLASARGRERAG